METLEYRDMLVGIWQDPTPGFFSARAWEEFGRTTPPQQIRLPFDDRRFIGYVDRLDELGPRELQYVGERLFDALFAGDILRLYVHLREQIAPAGARLRIRLRLDPPIVARLPWECLYDTREGLFLGNCPETTLVRYLDATGEPDAVPVRLPLRVLLAADTDAERPDPRVLREAFVAREALRPLEGEGLVAVQSLGRVLDEEPLTAERLVLRCRRDVDAVHLVLGAGLGGSPLELDLVDERSRRVPVDAARLGEELAAEAGARLVVLAGAAGAAGAAAAMASSLLCRVPALVGQRGRPPEDLLRRATETFYRAVAAMQPVDAALALARAEIASHVPLESGWLPPALFLSRRDARVFFNPARERVQRVYQLSEGKYRRRLREILNRIWPKPERYARQLLRWMPRGEPLASYAHAAEFLGQPQDAASLARHFQRLLLLGEAGSGKTMTLYRLFYEAAQPVLSYEAKSPLPLYVSLAELPAEADLVAAVGQGLDRELFASDLAEGRFLFLFDAADGLSAAAAVRLGERLGAFMQRYPMNRYVVAARRPLPVPIDLKNWVELLPFAEWEALDFLIDNDTIRAEPARLLYRQLAQSLGPKVGNPQILAMARRLWREGARVPQTVSGLFEAFFQVAGRGLVPELREGLLPRIALFMSEHDRVALTQALLEADLRSPEGGGLVAEILRRDLGERDAAEVLLGELGKTRLLRGPHAFAFPSLGFQEFLAAYALRGARLERLVELVAPARWTLVEGLPYNLARGPLHGSLPFVAALRTDGASLVERLVERDLLLAAECYREAPAARGADVALREAIESALARRDPVWGRLACASLMARGDRWAVARLEAIVADLAHPLRAPAVEALGTLRSHQSLPLLKAAALEKDPEVSRAALDALARIKAS